MQDRPQPATTFRVQRDGPSPAQQASDAQVQEYQAEIVAKTALIRALTGADAERDAAGRLRLRELRNDVEVATSKLRALELQQRDEAMADARQGGVTISTTGAPPRNDDIPDLPPNARDVSMLFIVCFAAAIILTPLMRAFGRILERRTPQQHLPPEIAQQLTRMEQAIETMAVEVERVSEGQRFATKLLAERERSAVDAGSR